MDYLFKAMAREDRVRIVGIDAKESVNSVCNAHNTLPLTTMAFARFLLAGVIIGSLEKSSTGISMSINSDGPIKHLYMQATPTGNFRGYIGKNDGDLDLKEEISVEKVVGDNGILSITKSFTDAEDFVSDVILTASDITQDIAYYFFASEQIPTIINLDIRLDENGKVNYAKGYLIQLMTGYEEEDVVFLENLKLSKIEDVENDLKNIFKDFNKLETITVKDICDCNKEKFARGIASLSVEDLKELSTDEEIEVVCQFCCSKYKYSKDEIFKMIESKK